MSTSPTLPSCPSWCRLGTGAAMPHIRNIDIVSGPPFASVSVEINLIHEGDGETLVRIGVMDEDAHIVSDDPDDAESFHRIDVRTAAALGFAITQLDPRGAHEVGLLLMEAVEIARDGGEMTEDAR